MKPNNAFRLAWWLAIAYAGAGAVAALRFYAGERGAPVVWPLAALFAVYGIFLALIRAKQQEPVRFLEIGVFFAGFLLLYAAAPLIVYAFNGFAFTPFNDPRLYYDEAKPKDIAVLAWWYVLFLAVFCAAYVLARPRRQRHGGPVLRKRPDVLLIIVSVAGIAALSACQMLILRVYGLSAKTYGDTYAILLRLPLIVQQFVSHLLDTVFTWQILAVVALASRYPRARLMLGVLLAGLLIMHLVNPGARTQLLLVFVAAAQVRDLFVKRLSFKVVLAAGLGGFLLFTALSVLRQSEWRREMSSPVQVLLSANEFEAMYGNAYDLHVTKRADGLALHQPALYFADFTSLIPQQLLPFEKTAPAFWYVRTYYSEYFAAGGGMAFGLLAEAIVGFGLIELVCRAALLGLIFGLLHRRLMSRPVSFAFLLFYVWLTVWSFNSIRNTTFSVFSSALYRFVLPVVAIYLVIGVIRAQRRVAYAAVRVAQPSEART